MNNYPAPLPKEQEISVNGLSIKLYVVEEGVWLLKDIQVARAYGISPVNVRRHVQRNKDTLIEGIHWFKKHGNLPRGFPHLRLWTRDGLIKLGDFIKTAEADTLLVALDVKSRQSTKTESAFVAVIRTTFEGILPISFQHPVDKYKVDIYFPSLKLAVEIDEFDHETYSQANESDRETVVRSTLGCEILRFNPNLPSNNVGRLINDILRRANTII